MKFTVNKTAFTKEVAKFMPFIERKTTIPILANLLICPSAAKDSKTSLMISGTDLDTFLTDTKFPAKVEKQGSISVPARKLSDTLKKLGTIDAEEISVSVTDNWFEMTCGPLTVKIAGMAPSSYPAIPKKPETSITIPAEVLATLISRTRHAVAKDESRYTLNGSLLMVKPESIAMVSTDGHRLAYCERNASKYAVTEETKTLIPVNVLDRLKPFLPQHGGAEGPSVKFSVDTNGDLFFQIGDYLVTSKPLQGKFPNWEAVMPQGNSKVIDLDNKQLAAALGRVSQFADERSMAVKFELVINEGLKLSASSTETGSASELIKAPCEDSMSIGFDARYLLDYLKTLDSEGVTMKFRDNQSSAVLVPTRPDEYKYQMVLMPVRL